ncbi:MAG: deoxyribose-phosphate aldolase [Lachnospiraceae bacterium]|nr:deoxyribose-phosphate aldolase [Candidatus Darwinimomas equi]
MTVQKINKYIDHTLLKADAAPEQIKKLCEEAKQYDFASVCVNTCYVPLCAEQLKDTDVKVCCVVGFPLGAMSTEAKAYETEWAVKHGADEVDMVINIGMTKAADWDYVRDDIRAVAAASGNALVKVIIETCLLTDDEKVKVCTLCKEAGADFVKTSTGFSTGGATVEDVRLMRRTAGPDMGVKAAGGIHTREEAKAMIEAGADRIGASSGIKIVEV